MSEKPPMKLASGKFELDKKIGAGCFGEVWRGMDAQTREPVAVKFEHHSGRNVGAPQLEQESEVLRLLARPKQPQGFAEVFHMGQEGRYHCLVMELLGKSLEDRLQGCNGRFKVRSAVLIAEQVLQRIEYLHSKGILHRDIKPENFMFGTKRKIHHVYLIDFGLSKRYWDQKHAAQRTKLSLTGTARYASINAHLGFEQSRRDDLEAIGHMLIYFLRGSLPWSGLDAKTQEEKYRKIREKKQATELDDLCKDHPDAFKIYLRTARGLEFKERPDYTGLRQLFRDLRVQVGNPADYAFEWFDGKDPGTLEPLNPWESPQQPDDQVESPARRGGGFFCFCGSTAKVRD